MPRTALVLWSSAVLVLALACALWGGLWGLLLAPVLSWQAAQAWGGDGHDGHRED